MKLLFTQGSRGKFKGKNDESRAEESFDEPTECQPPGNDEGLEQSRESARWVSTYFVYGDFSSLFEIINIFIIHLL